MSKAAELAALIGSQTALSNRNLIINGAMQVAQRGTSSTGITSASYPTCDRWYFNINSAGTWTVSQSTDAPAGSGFTNSFKADCTTADSSLAAGDYIQFQQRFEGQNLQQLKYGTSSAEKITLSFWVKATKTGTNVVMLYQDDAGDMINAQYTINASNTWEYKTLTFVGNTGDVITNDNTRGFICIWHLAAGSSRTSGSIMNTWGSYTTANEAVGQVNHADSTSNDWQITGVQLEIGEQDTPFEHRSFGEELLACQRYYEHTYPYGTAPGAANGGIGADHRYVGRETASNYGYYTAHYRVEKRAAATVTVYSYVGTANQIANGDTGGDYGAVGVIQSGTTSFLPRNTSGTGVSASALMYHFKADAEL